MVRKIIAIMAFGSMPTFATTVPRTIPTYSLHEREPDIRATHNTISATEGNQFTITLHGKAGTGYTWYIQELSEDYVTLIAKHILPCRHPGGRTTTIFKFHALQTGQETIVFEYARPWSWSIAQRATYSINITPRRQRALR